MLAPPHKGLYFRCFGYASALPLVCLGCASAVPLVCLGCALNVPRLCSASGVPLLCPSCAYFLGAFGVLPAVCKLAPLTAGDLLSEQYDFFYTYYISLTDIDSIVFILHRGASLPTAGSILKRSCLNNMWWMTRPASRHRSFSGGTVGQSSTTDLLNNSSARRHHVQTLHCFPSSRQHDTAHSIT